MFNIDTAKMFFQRIKFPGIDHEKQGFSITVRVSFKNWKKLAIAQVKIWAFFQIIQTNAYYVFRKINKKMLNSFHNNASFF